jgi:putative Ca2+/H+ antiporter (TMEM165/GDT1 family)
MGHWLLAFGSAYVAVFLLELPDKTTALTLVLASRFRGRAVLVGAGVAFAVQQIMAAAIAVLFAVGALLLLRESMSTDRDDDAMSGPRPATSFARAAVISFSTLFLAEWGDASQVTAIGVAARYAEPVAVGLGAFLALMSVSVIALLVGRKLRARVPAHLIQRGAAGLFGGFAVLVAVQAMA